LKFVETTISYAGGNLVWHSPIDYSSWLGWPMDDLPCEEAIDWTVGTAGKPMTTVELAAAMNIVEVYWPWWRKHSPYENSREEYDTHRYYIFNYALDIGEGQKGCELCGGEHAVYCSFTVAPGITRAASICGACNKDSNMWTKLAALPIPQLHPEIQKWRERHAINFYDTWKRGWQQATAWQDRKIDDVPVAAG